MMLTLLTFTATVLGAFFNRLRGGWLKTLLNTDSTNLCRAAWAVPTSILLLVCSGTIASNFWYLWLPALVLSSWLSWSAFGSGAHSIMSFDLWTVIFKSGSAQNTTENYTKGWLPNLFNGEPNIFWSLNKFWAYQVTGKAVEGVVRMGAMMLPLVYLYPWESLVIVSSGILWGPLFWVAWQVNDTKGWTLGEWLTGGLTWFVITAVFLW